ncbi:MAG TPA: MBL fold metallo-hydrolase [Polyangiaceae bacterium]|jgi:glyoxylase-like metal-dependent hydrolase (beta-lactamase superfamily II)
MTAHARHTIDCDVLPRFSAAYLRVAGDECAFVETHTTHAQPRLLAALAEHGLRPEQVRWIVVTHAHLDHAGGAGALLARCPNATLLAHPRAARHLVDPARLVASATQVYGAARFAELYGHIEPAPAARVRALEDGATFDLGDATLRVHHTAGHAKHHFVVDDPATGSVYTGDAFGLVYPALQARGRFALASTSPTDFDAAEARASIDRIVALGEKSACLTHYDAVDDVAAVGAQVRAWVDRSEGWLAEATRSDAPLADLTRELQAKIRAAIDEESTRRGLGFGDSEKKLLTLDVDLNAQGIAFVADRARKGTSPPS